MSIKSQIEFDRLRVIGRIVRRALDSMARSARPGITTDELDQIGATALAGAGAQAAPPKVYGFPGAVCISVNEEAIHGIPGTRTLRAGDLLKLDLVAEKDGFFADAAVTVPVGSITPEAARLLRCAEMAFEQGVKAARAGNRVYEIGRAVEREVKA
jgi:methionyl aminopeptidase